MPTPSETQFAAFRLKAGPILAEARGLTPAALAKLGDIARDLGIADDRVQEAIRSLHAGAKSSDPAVEKFRTRLRKDLSARKTIIGPEIEARIIAGGMQKYSLAEPVILDVLAEVSSELGLRRITGNEALAHFVEMVDGAVGEKTWLNRQAWDRLRMASEKWGLTFEDADQLVQQKLDSNRRSSFRGKLVGWLATYGSIGVVACVFVVLFVLWNRKNDEPVTEGPAGDSSATSGTEKVNPALPRPPAWWDYELAIAASGARREIPGMVEVYSSLIADAPAKRGAGYHELVVLGAKQAPSSGPRAIVEELLVACHAAEPDDSAAEKLRSSLVDLLPNSSTPLSTDASLYERAFWGMGVVRTAWQDKATPPKRRDALLAALGTAIGMAIPAGISAEELQTQTDSALSLQLFQHLIGAAPRHPASAPILHEFLATHGRLPTTPAEREPLEASYLAALLPSAETSWRDHQELLTRLARSKNPSVTLRMTDLLTRVTDWGLQSLLAEELVRQTGAKPRTSAPGDIARSIRQALGAAGVSSAQSQEDRWEVLRAQAGPALARRPPAAGNHGEILRETVELARLATLAAALSQGESGNSVFDELLAPKTTAEEEPLSEEPAAPAPERPRPLSNREKQQVEQYVSTLRNFRDHAPIQRTGSLRALAAAAPQIHDLTYNQATYVARYLLAEKCTAEEEGIQPTFAAIKRWKQLRLALADHLEEAKLPADKVQELIGSFLDFVPAGDVPSLRRALLVSVQKDLGKGQSALPESASALQKSAEQLAESYRTRARLAGISSGEISGASSPAQVMEILAASMATAGSTRKGTSPDSPARTTLEELEAVRFLGTSDLKKTVLLQRVILRAALERLSASRPRQAEAASLVVSGLETADAKAENQLVQLYLGEQSLLQLGMLYGAN